MSDPSPAPWYGATPDPILLGHMQTKGWDKMPANEAALAAVKAHRDAEQYVGTPADLLLKLPKDAGDAEGWKGVYRRLGAPEKADDYKFDGIDFGDEALTTDFTAAMRDVAAKFNVPASMAAEMASAAFKFIESKGQAEDADQTALIQAQKDALKKSWGTNYETNEFVAKQGAKAIADKLGPDGQAKISAAIDALDGQAGHAAVMEMFLAIGQAMGEGKFVAGSGPTAGGAMSREQALARRAELMGIDANGHKTLPGDKAWIDKYMKGDAAARREYASLTTIITGIAA